MDSGVFGVVGGWDSDGGHNNYGAREYKSSAEFIKDVLGDKNCQPMPGNRRVLLTACQLRSESRVRPTILESIV